MGCGYYLKFFALIAKGQKILAEKSPLIRHSSPKRPEDSPKQPGLDKALNSAENQAFLRDVSYLFIFAINTKLSWKMKSGYLNMKIRLRSSYR